MQELEQLQPGDLTPLTQICCGGDSLATFGEPNYVYGSQVLAYYGNFHATDVSKAVFVDATIKLLPSLSLEAGIRGEHVAVQDQTQVNLGALGGNVPYSKLPDVSANPVTPRASLTYQITDSDMVYASVAKGFRPGGGNPAAFLNSNPACKPSLNQLGYQSVPSGFDSDSLWSYELGTKDLFFDHRLSVQASVYYIKWNDIQSVVYLPTCANQFIGNRGEAVSKGFDLQIAAALTANLRLGAVVGYTDVYYVNAGYGAPPVDANGVVDGPPPLLNTAGGKLPNVVPWTAAMNAEYARDIGSLWHDSRTYLRLDYRWTGSVTPDPSSDSNVSGFDPDVSPFPNGSYGVLNVRMGVVHNGWDVSAFVNNATNADPTLGYTHNRPGSPLFYASALRPLTAGITAWYRF